MRLETWRYFDYWLIGAVAILIIFSVAMIDSSIARNPELIENNTVGRQILFAGIGFVLIILVTLLDYHFWAPIGRVLYVLIAFFLGLVAFGGETAFGASRWLDVGFAVVQPSELAKITIIVVMADFFARNQEKVRQLSWVIRSAILTMGLVGLVIIQPDLSTSITLLVIWGAMLFASGLKVKYAAIGGVLMVVLVVLGYLFFFEDYQKQRINNFFFTNPDARFGEEYNVNQALITIGSGGWLGKGYGQGSQVQLRFLKVRHSDFIYASIANELGFIGTVAIMALIFFVIFRILRNAQVARDTFGALLCYGVAAFIAFQTVVNIGMNLKLLPVTGLPLPLVSQGGSSLLAVMLGIGLVESVAARQKLS